MEFISPARNLAREIVCALAEGLSRRNQAMLGRSP
jgi:hypothetical protein